MTDKYIWGGGTDANDPVTNTKLNQNVAYLEEQIEGVAGIGQQFAQDISSTAGLVLGYKRGLFRNDNVITVVLDGTVSLTDDTTNYLEVDASGVSANTSGFTSNKVPLYEVVTSDGAITSISDRRALAALGGSTDDDEETGLELGETSDTAYRGDRGKTAYDHSQLTSGNPHGVTKYNIGLGNVTNTAQLTTDQLDTNTSLSANSDSKIPSQKAVKAYVDANSGGNNATSIRPNSVWRNYIKENDWLSSSAAEANQWNSVCWSPELALFCAVAQNGTNRVMTSPDGITWTAQTAAEASAWVSVCWSPELALFCAVAKSGTSYRVMTSPDGVTWTGQTAAEANGWYSVCWSPELSLFCAVAYSGTHRVMTSPDGITWTAQTAAEANGWNSVCWSPELGLFCAVATSGTNRVMTSSDGITWTAQTAAEASVWLSVCWSPELALLPHLALHHLCRQTAHHAFHSVGMAQHVR